MTVTEKESTKLSGCLTLMEVSELTGLSLPTTRKLVNEAGAVVKVGRRVLVLSDKLDQYLHSAAEKR